MLFKFANIKGTVHEDTRPCTLQSEHSGYLSEYVVLILLPCMLCFTLAVEYLSVDSSPCIFTHVHSADCQESEPSYTTCMGWVCPLFCISFVIQICKCACVCLQWKASHMFWHFSLNINLICSVYQSNYPLFSGDSLTFCTNSPSHMLIWMNITVTGDVEGNVDLVNRFLRQTYNMCLLLLLMYYFQYITMCI